MIYEEYEEIDDDITVVRGRMNKEVVKPDEVGIRKAETRV